MSRLFSGKNLSANHPELFSLRDHPLEKVEKEVGKLAKVVETLSNDPARKTPYNLQALEFLNNCKAAVVKLRDEHEHEHVSSSSPSM